ILAFSRIDASSPVWQHHDYDWWQRLAENFEHPLWVSLKGSYGVAFWDLIQPAFMFMVGVSMPFSYGRRSMMGQSDSSRMLHAILRSVVLILMGVFLNSIRDERTDWAFPNVLCQIGLGYFFAWLLLNRSYSVQVISLLMILGVNWLMFYVNTPPKDFDYSAVEAHEEDGEVFTDRFAQWSKNSNTAYQFDAWLLPKLRSADSDAETSNATDDSAAASTADKDGSEKLAQDSNPKKPALLRRLLFSNPEPYRPNRGGYTTLNFVPSIGTTLIGIMCGQLLLSGAVPAWRKLWMLVGAAALCYGVGLLMHHTMCPIVKRIWTPSWVFFSGGFIIGMLALFYLAFDLLPFRRIAFPLVVVGMNSILIYMMGQLIRGWTASQILRVHFTGLIEAVFGSTALDPEWYAPIVESTGVFLLFWLFLFWLYRQRIFLRI
ncbi:MAG: hypothetical protein KDA91_11845, partial [Planctomycetaceae bacterium]|nr:hypothetical protein [Planctomycetaceae bacterium]